MLEGNTQVKGVNYTDTHASVAHMDSIRTLMALAATNKWHLQQFDIGNVFLNADVDTLIYTRQVRGFEVQGKEDWVWRLKRTLYGTKCCRDPPSGLGLPEVP